MDKVREMLNPGTHSEEKVVHEAGEGNNVGLGTSAGTGGTSGLPHDGAIRVDDEIRVVDEHQHHAAHNGLAGGSGSHPATTEHASTAAHGGSKVGGTHDGLSFGDKWDPSADIAANVRRSQILALASSRAEKGAQDELLPDRRSSIAKLDEERRYSASRDPESVDDRIRALAHSRSEAGHHQNELLPDRRSSIAQLEREKEHGSSIPNDDIDGRIRALASSRSEKGHHQNELLADRRSSIQLAEDNRKHSMSYPAENPRKTSIQQFVSEEKRQEARKASIGGLEGADHPDTDPKDSARRSSVAAGLATYAAGTGQTFGTGQQDPKTSPLGTHGDGTDTQKVDAVTSRSAGGDAGHLGRDAGIVGGGGLAAREAHPGSEHPIGGVAEQRGVEHTPEHHHGRDAAVGGAAAGATYAALEEERQREWKREQEAQKAQHEREKEQKKHEKEIEHDRKKHEKEVEHEQKKHEHEVKKAEKQHEKDIKHAEKEAEKRHHEREAAAGVVAGGAAGAGAYEYSKHHEHGDPHHGAVQTSSTAAPAIDRDLRDFDVNRGPGAEAYHGSDVAGSATAGGVTAGDGALDTEPRNANREAAIVGGGVAGASATTAYEAEQHHHRDGAEHEKRHKDDKDEKTEKRSSFLGGLFSRNKDDKEDKEPKHEKLEKHDKHDDKVKDERRREQHAELLQAERLEPDERTDARREEPLAASSANPATTEDASGHTKLHKEPPLDVQQKQAHIASQMVTDATTGLPKDMSKAEPGLAGGTDGLP